MSGLVGYIGRRDAMPVILDALERLEYRGYDSAGLAVITDGSLKVSRTLGRPAVLAKKIKAADFKGGVGIGHTRWASHGKPSIRNAHPQVTASIAVVHNGILDNAPDIKRMLIKQNVKFRSETDTEILPHLINLNWRGSLLESVLAALKKLEGGLTCCVISSRDPDQLIAVRKGNPMVVGFGEGEYIAASDATAVIPHTRRMVFLRDGEVAALSHESVQFMDFDGNSIADHTPQKISWNPVMAEKRGYRHFLLKEIVESPRAVRETISPRIPVKSDRDAPGEFRFPCDIPQNVRKVIFCGSGSSYSAAMLGQLICESIAGISAEKQVASEYQIHRLVEKESLYVAISQSGETLDTLESAKYAQSSGAHVLAITNNPSSSLARLAQSVFITRAGPEVSVAASKTFNATVAASMLLAFNLARQGNTLSPEQQLNLRREMEKLPEHMELMITYEARLRRLAEGFAHNRSFFFIGRGLNFPVAHFAALTMKEVANIHAEALLGGEMKHGEISLMEKDTPVMFFANQKALKKNILHDMDELRARGARVIAVGFEDDAEMPAHCDEFIAVPVTPDSLAPLPAIIPAQLFIYYIALYNKKAIDRPRNIAKSVTV